MPGAGAQNGKGGPKVTRLCIKTVANVANVCREGGGHWNEPTTAESYTSWTRPWWASSVGSRYDATRICCWAPAPAEWRPQLPIDICRQWVKSLGTQVNGIPATLIIGKWRSCASKLVKVHSNGGGDATGTVVYTTKWQHLCRIIDDSCLSQACSVVI